MIKTFKTNVVFGSVPIGNMLDISLNMIYHIIDADIILLEHEPEFNFFIKKLETVCKEININLNIKANKYIYNLEDEREFIDKVNQEVVELSKTKKILVFSDEGSSLFLEPTNALKHELILQGMNFTVMSGPNSAISSVTNALPNIREFLFLGTFDYIEQSDEQLSRAMEMIKIFDGAAVILLNGPHIHKCLNTIKDKFGTSQYLDFGINLSAESETHIRGNVDRLLKIINANKNLFENNNYENRFSLVIMPDSFRYHLPPNNPYKTEEMSDNFIFNWKNIHSDIQT